MRHFAFASALALALAGCATTATTTTPAPQGPAADDRLNATLWFQKGLERDMVYRTVYRAAAQRLDAALADPTWDALPRQDRVVDARGLKPAIIVDVDETVLDNAPSQVRQIRAGSEFEPGTWDAWVAEHKARPLAGAAEFLSAAARRGVTVFYITNRKAYAVDATTQNLRDTGFPVAAASQVLGAGTEVEGCETKSPSDKSCRRQLVGRTHRVLMQFGDQTGDFVAAASSAQESRAAAVAPYADWLGERWFVLPNPMYGSWEDGVVGKEKDPARARALKLEALDDAK
jgi:5'-nucleotidase (lipoprotein e(P4) family)